MFVDGFPHPIGMLVQGDRIKRLAAAQVPHPLDETERFEQAHPVAHRFSGLADTGGHLRYPERATVKKARQHVQTPIVPHDRFQPG